MAAVPKPTIWVGNKTTGEITSSDGDLIAEVVLVKHVQVIARAPELLNALITSTRVLKLGGFGVDCEAQVRANEDLIKRITK
jgi:hypothetical protein